MVFLHHKSKYLLSLDELYVVIFLYDYKHLNKQEEKQPEPHQARGVPRGFTVGL